MLEGPHGGTPLTTPAQPPAGSQHQLPDREEAILDIQPSGVLLMEALADR